MKFLRPLVLGILTLASIHASARQPVPIVNYENLPVADAALGEAGVREAIESTARTQNWEVQEIAPGRLLATLVVRQKHTVMTEIGYSATSYSLTYRDSINMNYAPVSGEPGVIHPFYNRWVGSLKDGIRFALGKR